MRGREKEIWEGGGSNMGMLAVQALTPLTWMYTCIHGMNLVYELASKVQSQHWHSSLARDYASLSPSHSLISILQAEAGTITRALQSTYIYTQYAH